ncbi:MAG TPA: hypothetical protein VJV78_00875 [Polyangiales bacterium]|nr:hypothetical protein [Polyangiales bacterium]
MRATARALLSSAALALLGTVACGGGSPAGSSSPAVTTPVPGAAAGGAGASGTPAAGGAGASGTAAIGGASAGTGGTQDGGVAGAPRAGADAGPVVCRVSDDPMLLDEDADGGIAPDCHDIHRTIILENCIGYCHHNRGAPSAGLNLQSPCVADRLLDAPSHCEGLPIIDSKDPDRSFLLDKLEHMMPRCGKSMPEGWHLPPNQVACMSAWVHAVVRSLHKP